MRALRLVTLGTLSVLASCWAGAMVIAGLWLVRDAPPRWPAAAVPAALGGVALVAMGLFLFLTLVADRWFPDAGRRVGWWLEVALLCIFIPSLSIVGLWVFFGAHR